MNEKDIKSIVESVLKELEGVESAKASEQTEPPLHDLMDYDLYSWSSVPDPCNPDALRNMVASTPSRVGVWRAGPRPQVDHWLRFRADHAVAKDAVMKEIDPGLIKSFDLFTVQTVVKDKDEYLTRPDHGRLLSEEAKKTILENCPKGAPVQVIVVDGLSSAAIEENLGDFLPAFKEAIKSHDLAMGKPFFVKYGRVGVMEEVGELLEPEVLLELVGERPGLVTATSMSAYIGYKPTHEMVESDRTLVANIHKAGLPAIEAAAHVAGIVKEIYDAKASGMKFKNRAKES